MTYAELQAEVQVLLIDTPSAITSLTGRFVNRAIRKLQTKHNFKVMEAETSGTTALLTRNLVAVPSDWKEARGRPFWQELGTTYFMAYTDIQAEAESRWGSDPDFDFGEPKMIFENAETSMFEVFPFPDGAATTATGEYTVHIPYWRYLPALASDGSTNWFTANAEDYIIYRATGFGFYANEDEDRGDKWFRLAASEYGDVVRADKQRRLANTDTLVPHFGVMPPHVQE